MSRTAAVSTDPTAAAPAVRPRFDAEAEAAWLEEHPDNAIWHVARKKAPGQFAAVASTRGMEFDEIGFGARYGPGTYTRYLRSSRAKGRNIRTEEFEIDESIYGKASEAPAPLPFPLPSPPAAFTHHPAPAPAPSPAPEGNLGLFQLLIAQQQAQSQQTTALFTALIGLLSNKAQASPVSEMIDGLSKLQRMQKNGNALPDAGGEDESGLAGLGRFLAPLGEAAAQELAKPRQPSPMHPQQLRAVQQHPQQPRPALAGPQHSPQPGNAAQGQQPAPTPHQAEAELVEQLAPLAFNGDRKAAAKTLRRVGMLLDLVSEQDAENFSAGDYAAPLHDALGPLMDFADQAQAGILAEWFTTIYPELAPHRARIEEVEIEARALRDSDPDADAEDQDNDAAPEVIDAPAPASLPLVSIGPAGIADPSSTEIIDAPPPAPAPAAKPATKKKPAK